MSYYHNEIAVLNRMEMELTRKLALTKYGIFRRLTSFNMSAIYGAVLDMQDRMKKILIDFAPTPFERGIIAARNVAREKTPQFAETSRKNSAPLLDPSFFRWYDQTVDASLHRYGDRARKEISKLITRGELEGYSTEENRANLQMHVEGLFGWQARRVARTECMRLWNLGHFAELHADESVTGYRYSVVMDDRTSHYCKPLEGVCVRKEDIIYVPPLHPNCRTIVEPIFDFDEDYTSGEIKWGDASGAHGIEGFGTIPPSLASVKTTTVAEPQPEIPPSPPSVKMLYHGTVAETPPSNFQRAKSNDKGVVAWLTPDKRYASQYAVGGVGRYQVTYRRPLDIRSITRAEHYDVERTVNEWIRLLAKKGLNVRLLHADMGDELVKFWDLLYGYDIDATAVTDIAEALRASDFDVLIETEFRDQQPVAAYGLLREGMEKLIGVVRDI